MQLIAALERQARLEEVQSQSSQISTTNVFHVKLPCYEGFIHFNISLEVPRDRIPAILSTAAPLSAATYFMSCRELHAWPT